MIDSSKCFISFVVPVYNAERWIGNCIDSILKQTESNFEILLIDDGSEDGSGRVCDDYASQDYRLNVIHKPNQGVSNARNTALDVVKGELILFVDADDVIHPQTVETLHHIHQKYNADCYVWECQEFENEISFFAYSESCVKKYSCSEMVTKVLDPYGTIQGYACNKAFRKEKLTHRFASDIAIQEDLLFVCEYLASLPKNSFCCYLNQRMYGYRQHISSVCKQAFSHKHITMLCARQRLIDVLQKSAILDDIQMRKLKGNLAKSVCVMNKKIFLSKDSQLKKDYQVIDAVWELYRSFCKYERWSIKEKMYLWFQRLCFAIRQRRKAV